MGDTRIIEQVHGILTRSDVNVLSNDAGDSFMVPVGDSAAVFVDFYEWANDQTIIRLKSYVLEGVEADENLVLGIVNRLNAGLNFAKFYYVPDPGLIVAEYDILGNDLQASELLNALASVGSMSDQYDDELQRDLGSGRRARDVFEREREQRGVVPA